MNRVWVGVLSLSLCGFPALASAAASEATAPTSGFRAEFLDQLNEVEKKMIALAEAVPAEKYAWRPAEGVRSVSEVYMHLAGANFSLPRFIGVDPPSTYERGMERTVTEKAKVVDWLRQSFAHVRQATFETADADLDKAVKVFGRDATVRSVFLLMATHMHEHLGQAIAYARMNGVVPPWTAARQAQLQQSKPE